MSSEQAAGSKHGKPSRWEPDCTPSLLSYMFGLATYMVCGGRVLALRLAPAELATMLREKPPVWNPSAEHVFGRPWTKSVLPMGSRTSFGSKAGLFHVRSSPADATRWPDCVHDCSPSSWYEFDTGGVVRISTICRSVAHKTSGRGSCTLASE